jgi:alcohol dehydrogenase (cytochrome c)
MAYDSAKLLWNTELVPGATQACFGTPLVVKDKIVIGVGGLGVRASLDAYDAATGKLAWRFYTIPAVGEPGSETWDHESARSGGEAMLAGSFDPYLNTIYRGTGPPRNRGGWTGDELFTSSVVALNAGTGKLEWYFQFTPNDTQGWGAMQTPILVDAVFQGKPRKLLVAANPNGFYYILDRATGQFLQGTPFVEQTWTRSLDAHGRPALQGPKRCPDVSGATRSSPSYDDHSGLLYLAARDGCGSAVPADGEMHLRAVEVAIGKVAWDYKQIGRWWSTGELATGESVFAVEALRILALHDAATGKRLHAMTFANPILAGPTTYRIGDKQYIALTAGSYVVALGLR